MGHNETESDSVRSIISTQILYDNNNMSQGKGGLLFIATGAVLGGPWQHH